MEKVCCEKAKETEAFKWNPFNQLVQCHSCGHVYEPKVYGIGEFSETTLEHLLERYPKLTRESANQLLTYEGVSFELVREKMRLTPYSIRTIEMITGVLLKLPEEVVKAYEYAGIEEKTSLVMDERGEVVYKA